ncbi:MAG TPA: TolC family protein [Thermoanaerobaculia bacterium]|jgi:outer membrane protein TolC|nr:TolC family protein [Thermoanaerobaculia bacterium]
MRTPRLRFNPTKNRRAVLALLLGLLAAGGPARAAELRVNTQAVRPPAEPPALEIKGGKVQLSVDQAVEIALRQNLDLVVQRYVRTQQRLAIVQSLGIYDLLASVNVLDSSSTSPAVSQVNGSKNEIQSGGFSFTQALPWGGNVIVGYDDSKSVNNSPLRSAATLFNNGFNFTYNQPLLQGFGRLATERGILVARNSSDVGRQQFALQVTSTIQQVENAYWNLVEAKDQLNVAEESLGLAKELHERNRIQVEVGTMAPLEAVQSEAAIATREGVIIGATAAVGNAEDVLRRLLNVPSGSLWETPIEPTTKPETDRISINVNDALQTAYDARPELRSQDLQLALAKLNSEYFRSLLKPSLNLQVQYGYSGAAPTFNVAFDQVTGLSFNNWQAALVLSYPIQNRSARAQSASANLDVDRFKLLYESEKTLVATEVRTAARGVETAAKQIDAARKSTEYQEKNLDAERKKYENGMSTSFNITQIQDQLTQARSTQVQAIVGYRTALAEYYRAIGKLPVQDGVTIDDPDDPSLSRFSLRRVKLPGEN